MPISECTKKGISYKKDVCVHTCLYIYIYIHMYVYIYKYVLGQGYRDFLKPGVFLGPGELDPASPLVTLQDLCHAWVPRSRT